LTAAATFVGAGFCGAAASAFSLATFLVLLLGSRALSSRGLS